MELEVHTIPMSNTTKYQGLYTEELDVGRCLM